MTQSGFIAAMAAELAFAAYSSPSTVQSRASEWIIVSNWGGNRDFLTLSRTGVPVQGHDAPPGLQPCCTYLGILLSRAGADTEEVSEYLLMRNQPADIPVGGMFHPTDGYVSLTLSDGIPSVMGHGRFAHAAASLGGAPVMNDVPHPAPGAPKACAWHLRATRRPWIGEVAAADRLKPLLAATSRARALPRSRRPEQVLVVPPRKDDTTSPEARCAAVKPEGPDPLASDPLASGPLASASPTPHNRRRKRPEAKHDVTSEA